ncbi:FAD-binding oxidoreductase [Kyrpidia spormannii]|uniref:FAD-binding oxidoreductase n=2 Tax=Kyrpidia spormannii TaxID=2055160 RepID=A0A2K8N8U8_9BACL|nr:FAD-linked oxidase C-terminal domain-containing protein [Kyrpidia spormannii]ATY85751.1 FAD-binding oxidoreductase [Kyrpidia spormannii]CAB3394404.1 glycolate oxidase subunit, FAD-linked [Kyrpidia spormannii]CAB3395347.1 glycolate oxidase subunit, FAD-linked [Kyrpidia spormannii]
MSAAREKLVEELARIVGPRNVISDRHQLMAYECDGYTIQRGVPAAVVFPADTDQVAAVVKYLHREKIPFVPRGAGTGLSGGAIPLHGEVVVNLVRMNRILHIDYENRYAVVQPGVVNRRLSQVVAGRGYYYAPDPSSQQACTLGGNVGENAGGPHCLKYGVTTNHVLALEWVLPDGQVVMVGGPNGDDVGYDLRGLFIGTEGTLGIVTRIWVRLLKKQIGVKTILALFDRVEDASRAVSGIIAKGILPGALEMMDRLAMRAVEAGAYPVGYPEDIEAVLLLELDGSAEGLEDQAEDAVKVCKEHGVRDVRVAASEPERTLWWNNRKTAFGAMGNISPDYLVQDGVIPRSTLPEVLTRIAEISKDSGLRIANVFHAGDGNLHPLVLFDSGVPGETQRAVETGSRVLQVCADVGGSITGEHGVGLEKMYDMEKIFSPADIDYQLKIRGIWNAEELCNPGKLFPRPAKCIDAKAMAAAGRG